MPNVKNNAAAQETCRKLIDAAGEVFAEHGLHAATIKQITDRAGVNTAAINYHFRDKFELYAAVIRHALSRTPVVPCEDNFAGSPEDRLRSFIRNVIEDLFDPHRPAWGITLLAHEFAQPTAALDPVVEELIRPRASCLDAIIRDILGPRATDDQVARAGGSVSSQCFAYLYHGQVIRRLYPDLLLRKNSETLVAHIAEFSLAGLRAMRKSLESRRTRATVRSSTKPSRKPRAAVLREP